VVKLGRLLLIALAAVPGAAAATKQAGTLLFPAWSPDGKTIAWADAPYAGVPSPPGWQIWTARPDGSKPHRVTRGAALSEGLAQLGWAGRRTLAFAGNFSVYTQQLGGKPKQLAANIGDSFSTDARGTRFAYTTSACGQGQCPSRIVVLDTTTGQRRVIGDVTSQYSAPTLSPDGREVAFTSPNGLMTADVAGTSVRTLAPLGSCPQWSPDGTRILYVGTGGDLLVIPAAGGASTPLTAQPVGCGYSPFNFGWSPNGKRVALIDPPGGRLSLIAVATQKARTLKAFGHVAGFAWSPDSSRLLVAARPSPAACTSLWRIDATGAHRTLIARC
jgi:dipeptidyl aminopeptidase/acylaminoacyl peptidase